MTSTSLSSQHDANANAVGGGGDVWRDFADDGRHNDDNDNEEDNDDDDDDDEYEQSDDESEIELERSKLRADGKVLCRSFVLFSISSFC